MLGSLHRLHREPVFYLIAMRKVGLVLRFKESCESLVCHVNVELGDELERSVHRENGNAYVDNINVKVCDILCNRSAAACMAATSSSGPIRQQVSKVKGASTRAFKI